MYIKGEDWWVYEPARDVSEVWKAICNVRDQMKIAYQNKQWLDGSRNYSVKEGYGWLTRQY